MRAMVDAQAFRKALATLRPKNRQFKRIREPSVRVTSTEKGLVFMGTLDSTAMVDAEVVELGETAIPLEPIYRLLATYAKGAKVLVRTEGERVYVDRLSFAVPKLLDAE